MGVFGNINGVFSALGKSYIKLEFDDNAELLSFQKRINEGSEAAEAEFEDGEFKPVNGTDLGAAGDLYLVRDLRTRARKEPGETVSNKNLRFYKIEGEKVSNFNKDIYEKDSYFARKIDGYRNIYITKKNGNYYTQFTFFEPRKKENYNVPTLAGYWRNVDTLVNINKVLNYQATPYRTDDNLQLLEDRGRADGVIHRNTDNITTFYGWITDAYNKELRQNAFNEFYNERQKIEDKYYSKYQKKLLTDFYTNPTSYKIRLIDSYSGGKTSSAIGDSERDEFVGLLKDSGLSSLGAPGDVYLVTDTRKNPRKELNETAAFKKIDIEKFNVNALKALQDSDPLLYEEIKAGINAKTTLNKNNIAEVLKREIIADVKDFANKNDSGKELSDINTPATITPLMKQYNEIKHKYPDAVLLFKVGTYYETFGEDAKKIASVLGIRLTNRAGQYYAGFKVRDLDKNLKKLIKAGVKVAVCEQTEQALGAVNYYVKAYYPGLGKTANNLLYNDNSIIDCRGFKPTYKILPSYDSFFDVAKNKNTFAGFGLDDTKKLIADTCRKHYKDCEKIAKHLKGDCLIQSAFNLWHWLRHNIRYEYDREGREEVRAPLRTWQDRERGVDCDCLSVFAWCVLKCMGYNPAFELAAFKNRENFSHIYINCDGIVVDRVWFIFNSRPPLVTKTEIYKVNLQDLGKLF